MKVQETTSKLMDSLGLISQADSNAWSAAKQENTITSYKIYVESYPEGVFIPTANEAISDLDQLQKEEQQRADSIAKRNRKKLEVVKRADEEREAVENLRNEVLKEIADNMVTLPSGSFTMGCPKSYRPPTWDEYETGREVRFGLCSQYEHPPHEVTLSSFSISKYELTQAQWEAVMGNNPSYFSNCPNCPVEFVSWEEVQVFIQKLNQYTGMNYRLPTEAEWEFAARGCQSNNTFRYAGCHDEMELSWNRKNSESRTHPVGQKLPNELGLYDMTGNVGEWCQDWFGKFYYNVSLPTNPKGPTSGSERMIRGGDWANWHIHNRTTERKRLNPNKKVNTVGFRLVLLKQNSPFNRRENISVALIAESLRTNSRSTVSKKPSSFAPNLS